MSEPFNPFAPVPETVQEVTPEPVAPVEPVQEVVPEPVAPVYVEPVQQYVPEVVAPVYVEPVAAPEFVQEVAVESVPEAAFMVVQRGNVGDAVREVQGELRVAGYDPQDADGEFGPTTDLELRKFQQDNGLNADGIANRLTRNTLKERNI